MLYKVLSLHHEEENALFFSVQRPSRRLREQRWCNSRTPDGETVEQSW